ncbi:hypothetical protein [Halolamina salina]|uniref:Uncharacterized protein n=1 Tax=Halolamina salina TaxID=1220023 RepID=A0ABD6B842_9EURY
MLLVLLAQLPIFAVFADIPLVGDSFLGATVLWVVGALVWSMYTAVLLLAPLADIRDHPDRDSWGPFETLNVYTYVSVRQISIRLLHGVIGFVLAFIGTVLFVATPPLLVLPVVVMMTSVVMMGAHVGVKDPSEETKRRL